MHIVLAKFWILVGLGDVLRPNFLRTRQNLTYPFISDSLNRVHCLLDCTLSAGESDIDKLASTRALFSLLGHLDVLDTRDRLQLIDFGPLWADDDTGTTGWDLQYILMLALIIIILLIVTSLGGLGVNDLDSRATVLGEGYRVKVSY